MRNMNGPTHLTGSGRTAERLPGRTQKTNHIAGAKIATASIGPSSAVR